METRYSDATVPLEGSRKNGRRLGDSTNSQGTKFAKISVTIRTLLTLGITLAIISSISAQPPPFISVKDQTFQLNNRPYYFIGTNYWYGSLLGLETDKKRGIT